jgi:hypothetical protein
MEPIQYSLELPIDAPVDLSKQHFIRTIKKQKIKNFGLIGRRNEDGFFSSEEPELRGRPRELMQRFGEDPKEVFQKIALRLAREESKNEDGAWDWRIWEQKFFQILAFRRFLPHPLLFTGLEAGEYPHSWSFKPKDEVNALVEALQALRSQRGFAGLRFHTQGLRSLDSFSAIEEFSQSLRSQIFKQPKPHPEIQAVVAAHDSNLPKFLAAMEGDRARVWKGLAIVLDQGLAAYPSVYEPLLLQVHHLTRQAPSQALELIFQALPEETNAPALSLERPLLGAINLAAFVDSEMKKILWPELKSALATIIRFAANWRKTTIAEAEPSAPAPWIGVVGWGQALDALDLGYREERALELTARISFLMRQEVAELLRRHEIQKNSTVGSLDFPLRPVFSRFFAQLGGVSSGLLPYATLGLDQEIVKMQAAFLGGARGICGISKPDRLEPEKFVELIIQLATDGWRGVRFLP